MLVNRNFIWAGLGVLIVIIATLSVRGCINSRKPPAVISPVQPSIDSVKKSVAETKRILDSLKKEDVIIKRQNDSLHQVTERQSDLIALRTQQVITWKKQYELAVKYKDTGTALASCDSMAQQIDSLIVQVNEREVSTHQLQNSYDSLLSNTSIRIARLEFDNAFLKEQFDNVVGNYKGLEKENASLKRKAGKRISVGSGAGGTLIFGKPMAVIDIISVHYSWFKL